jgi:hypothetical protein
LLKKSIPAIAPALLYLPPSMAVAWIFSAREAKSVIFALLHFSNTFVFEKWRLVPRPCWTGVRMPRSAGMRGSGHRRLLKNSFFSSLLCGRGTDRHFSST